MPAKPIAPTTDDGRMFTMARLDIATSRALDEWIASLPDPQPERADAIGAALRDFLTGLGRLRHVKPGDGPGWH